jgi:hypothetical protein
MSLTQDMTYEGLFEGLPTSWLNDQILQDATDRVRKEPASLGHAPYLVPPARRDFFCRLGDMTSRRSGDHTPEWMPMITCIARFECMFSVRDQRMRHSYLAIIWLQDDFAMPIAAAVLESIKAVDWRSHAFDFEY